MNKSLVCLWSLSILASAAILMVTGTCAATARAAARDARHSLRTASEQATELVRLRQGRHEFSERLAGGLASKVAGAMASAGLATASLQSLSPEAQAAISGQTKLSRQRATLTLSNVSLPQVGTFLNAWRSAEPDWIISGIDLTPITSKDAPSIGSDLPLRAVISFEGVFKDPAGASR
ncbi:MAG: hypothetical protein KF678_15430 [Phycisphaeraceae bacterium]|nr:hypothetical protein [Phycisphaeraceae bacterium]